MPYTALSAGIRLGKVGAMYGATRTSYRVLATTLLAVVSVLVQCKAAMTRADIGTNSILTHVLAPSVVDHAFVFIYNHST